MSATYRGHRSEHEQAQGMLPSVNIERHQVTIDGVTLPGSWIEKNGVTIHPTDAGANRLTVTLLVADVTVDDAALPQVRVLPEGDKDA